MTRPRVHDYAALEVEYLNSDISLREMCRRHGIKSYSTVAEYARSHGWYERRAKIIASSEDKLIEKVSEKRADDEAGRLNDYRDLALNVIQAALYKFANDLKDPETSIAPSDLIKLVNQGLLLLGQPTSRTEERRLELSGSLGGLPPELLRRLAEATRDPLVISAGPPSPSGPEGTRPN